MLDIEARVLIGWLANVFMLRWPTFRTASICMAYLDYGGCDYGECEYGRCEYSECDPNPNPYKNPYPKPYPNPYPNP